MVENRRHYDGLTDSQKIDRIIERLDDLMETFPFGLEAHKKVHEEMENSAKAEAEFIRDLKRTLAKNSIIALLMFILSAAVVGFAVKWGNFLRGLT